MSWLGVRCWPDRVALVVVDDAPSSPVVAFQRRERAPAGDIDLGQLARWIQQLATEVLEATAPEGLALYTSSGEVDQVRASLEGAVAAAAGRRAIPTKLVHRKNVWKPIGVANAKTEAWNAHLRSAAPFVGLVAELWEATAASLAAGRRAAA